MRHIHAGFGFLDRVCAIREFICDIPVYKGQKRVTMAINFVTKNCYKCVSTRDNDNVIFAVFSL